MDSKLLLMAIVAIAAVFAIGSPIDSAVAQNSVAEPDGEGEGKDGEHKGKSCPSKERKASIDAGFNL